jgi:hypothetical protein
MIRHGDTTWLTILRKPLHAGSPTYIPTVGPVTPGNLGFEGPAEWLRDQGYDVTSWGAGPNGGFRAELRRL